MINDYLMLSCSFLHHSPALYPDTCTASLRFLVNNTATLFYDVFFSVRIPSRSMTGHFMIYGQDHPVVSLTRQDKVHAGLKNRGSTVEHDQTDRGKERTKSSQ
jgi:predicted esterase